jgi:LuxR family maltose regulon positive regulatory protein
MRELEQTIVATKLVPPVSRRHRLISRRKLAAVPLRGQTPRLTLVTAPAGYGKTSLLYQWYNAVRAEGDTAVWISLDALDSVPVRFVRHLIAALRAQHNGVGELALRYIDSAVRPILTTPLGQLVNEVRDIERRVVLFLDDYHLIDSAEVDEFADYLLGLAPDNLHLAIASRLVPRLNLSALRLRDQLLEVDAKSLSFDRAETASFLASSSVQHLNPNEVDLLHARSEGWVAGLQLAVVALKGRSGASELAATFTGNFRDIADYLARAVLTDQSGEIQDFLLSSAILQRFNASVCQDLTGNGRCQEIIERLERANLFIVPLDDQRIWYRYHHLFQDFLQGMLRRTRPEQMVTLYRRASEWFFRNSLGAEAVGYALLSGDLDRASQMAEAHALQRILAGFVPEVYRWLADLPRELLQRNAALAGLSCLAMWHLFQQKEAARLLEEFEQQIRRMDGAGEAAAVLGNDALLHRAGIAVCQSRNPADVLALLDRIDVTQLSDFYRGVYNNVRGIALGELNRSPEALSCYRTAAATYRIIRSSLGLACSYYLESLMQLEAGNLRAIDALLAQVPDEQVFATASARYIYPSMLDCIRGVLLFERGEYEAAQPLLENNLALALEVGHLKMCSLVFVSYARLLAICMRLTEANEQLERLSAHLRRNEPDSPRALIIADCERIHLALRMGQTIRAQEIASAYGVEFAGDPPVLPVHWGRLECLSALSWCRAKLALGEPRAALPVLRRLARLAQAAGRLRRYQEMRLMEAMALWNLDDSQAALDVFLRVLMTCAGQRLVSLTAHEGPGIVELIDGLRRRREVLAIDRQYLAKVYRAATRGRGADTLTRDLPDQGVAVLHRDDFTDKERAVLELVALGRSNAAISQRLGITTHTVKWHLANVYAKLQVNNRTAAISAARANRVIL